MSDLETVRHALQTLGLLDIPGCEEEAEVALRSLASVTEENERLRAGWDEAVSALPADITLLREQLASERARAEEAERYRDANEEKARIWSAQRDDAERRASLAEYGVKLAEERAGRAEEALAICQEQMEIEFGSGPSLNPESLPGPDDVAGIMEPNSESETG